MSTKTGCERAEHPWGSSGDKGRAHCQWVTGIRHSLLCGSDSFPSLCPSFILWIFSSHCLCVVLILTLIFQILIWPLKLCPPPFPFLSLRLFAEMNGFHLFFPLPQEEITQSTKIAKSLTGLVAQSWPTLCDPLDRSPPGSPVHGDSPGKNPEWVAVPSCRGSF